MYEVARRSGLFAALLLIAGCAKGQESTVQRPLATPKTSNQAQNKVVEKPVAEGGAENHSETAATDVPTFQPINADTPGPAKGLTPEQLLPAQLNGFKRSVLGTDAALPELGLELPGHHARFEKAGKKIDIFLYSVADRDFEALRQPLYEKLDSKQAAPLKSVFGGKIGSFWWNLRYRLKGSGEQGIFWCNKNWLLYVRSAELANVGAFFDAYVDAIFIDGYVKTR